jgi:hypothetical protein
MHVHTFIGWEYYVYTYFGFLLPISMINAGIVSPLVFLFSIIPKIEKRMGVKLVYPKFYDSTPFGKGTRVAEIPICIASEYFFRFFNKTTKNIKFYKNYALIKADFDITTFSRREIVWSVLTVISYFLFFSLGALFYFMGV